MEEKDFAGIVNEAIDAKASELSKTIESKNKETSDSVEALKTELKSAKEAVQKQGEEITKLKETRVSVNQKLNPVETVLKENKDRIESWKASKSGSVELELKAGVTIDAAQIGDDDRASVSTIPGIGQLPVRRPFMQDLFNVQNVNSEYIQYWDQVTVNRDAQNTIRCAPITTTTTIDWGRQSCQIKKVKDYITICEDMLDDYAFVSGEVNNLITSSVELKKDNDLLLGDGTGNVIKGLAASAATFNAATVGADYSAAVDTPSLYDLIYVVGAQISAAGLENKWFANFALVNPKDATLMRLSKDADKNYLAPPFVSNGFDVVNGIVIIENPLVPENQMYVGDFRQGTVYRRKNPVIEMSFENRENFEDELVTVKAYERMALVIRNVDANAFIHVADIAAALTAITKP